MIAGRALTPPRGRGDAAAGGGRKASRTNILSYASPGFCSRSCGLGMTLILALAYPGDDLNEVDAPMRYNLHLGARPSGADLEEHDADPGWARDGGLVAVVLFCCVFWGFAFVLGLVGFGRLPVTPTVPRARR